MQRNIAYELLDPLRDTKNKKDFYQASSRSLHKSLGRTGSTWDAKHMGSFLHESRYSNWSKIAENNSSFISTKNNLRNSTHDNFYKGNISESKNVSKIGYSDVNPLVGQSAVNQSSSMALKDYLEKPSPRRYESPKSAVYCNAKPSKYISNTIKFKVTDPLTFHHVP